MPPIVAALRRGDRDVVLSLSAKLLGLAHALLPGVIVRAFALANRYLPNDNQGERFRQVRGRELAPAAAAPASAPRAWSASRADSGAAAAKR